MVLRNMTINLFGFKSTSRSILFSKLKLRHITASKNESIYRKNEPLLTFKRKLSTIHVGEKMNVWQTGEFEGVEGIHWCSARIPIIIKPSEVLTKVSAASVNPIDVAVLGGYGRNILNVLRDVDQLKKGHCSRNEHGFPLTVGRDFVGEVVRVGHCVSNIEAGDKVWGVVSPQRQGSHAEYVVTDSCNVSLKPESVTDVEAASLPYVGLTSWSAAVVTGGMVPNDCFGSRVLVIGASGGVGTFISQLLSTWGAEVVGVCSKDAFDLAISCGLSEIHDYRDPETYLKLTAHPRFDLILDAAGFNDQRWAEGLKEWSNASYVTLLSPLLKNTDQSGLVTGLLKSILKLAHQNSSTISRGRFCKWAYYMPNQRALKEISKLVSEKRIRPVIDRVFKKEDGKMAYEHVRDGPNRGKTVIDFNSSNS